MSHKSVEWPALKPTSQTSTVLEAARSHDAEEVPHRMELEGIRVRAALEERHARLARGALEAFLQVLLEFDPHLAETSWNGVVGAAQANDLGRGLGLAVGRGVEIRDDGARPSRGGGRGLASARRDLRLAIQWHEIKRDVRPQRRPGLGEHRI